MSTEPAARDPDTQPIPKIGSDERKRAALALGVLAVVAVLVVAVMIYTLGSSNSSSPSPHTTIPSGPAVTVTGAAATKHTSPSTTPRPSPTKTAPTTSPPSGPVSCPTANRCALPDDAGNVAQALSSFRRAHGLQAITGSVTRAAQDCVLHSGDESSCPSGYFWEPVGRSGTEVIDKIAASGGRGLGWLLNPKMTRIQLGWAYVPSTKSFECVVVSSA